jgi:hypothetical protein
MELRYVLFNGHDQEMLTSVAQGTVVLGIKL